MIFAPCVRQYRFKVLAAGQIYAEQSYSISLCFSRGFEQYGIQYRVDALIILQAPRPSLADYVMVQEDWNGVG